MKTSFLTRLFSCLLAAVMIFTTFMAHAGAANGDGKYLKDVYIAYGETKAEAENWLRDNGWEPFADLNEGKTSDSFKHQPAAVLGIKRTNDANEAITDMAAMNMKGGYSFDDYEGLVAQKKADITEFINTFVPALEEYRANYKGEGSEGGQKRAQMAHDLLNKFYDGDPNGEYAVNDTGKPLGDLLLNKTKTEIGDNAYNALSAEQKLNTADLQQIILESSGPAVMIIKQALTLATDTAETSWLDRLNGLSGEGLVERIAEFAPEVKGQNLARSAAMSLLAAHFEDYAKELATDWIDVHENILWYETYCNENNLWPEENEADEAFTARLESFFDDLKENDENRFIDESTHFMRVASYYDKLFEVEYAGEWGETLYDFFCPEDENAYYGDKYEYFAPIAASLSDGQRAALEFLSLTTLLKLSLNSDAVMEADFPSVDDIFKDEKDKMLGSISIYSGINRAIFRKGVALTSDALQQKAMGNDPYAGILNEEGIVGSCTYLALTLGTIAFIAGTVMFAKTIKAIDFYIELSQQPMQYGAEGEITFGLIDQMEAQEMAASLKTVNTWGKFLMGIGGALMIAAAVLKGVQLYNYYNRTFSAIPVMIVDEADIVSYTTDSSGRQVKSINFDQFAYYEVVKCNRQEIGLHTSAQVGVSDYAEWGCGDAADINADVGTQWLALYINRSKAKGDPILADSLTLKTGKDSEKTPKGYSGCLHMFNEENPVKIDNRDYCYRSDNDGMYLYWKTEKDSSLTASTFSGGTIAISAIGGLIAGIAGTTLFMLPKKKKNDAETAGA